MAKQIAADGHFNHAADQPREKTKNTQEIQQPEENL
jgi:hypothetical protein